MSFILLHGYSLVDQDASILEATYSSESYLTRVTSELPSFNKILINGKFIWSFLIALLFKNGTLESLQPLMYINSLLLLIISFSFLNFNLKSSLFFLLIILAFPETYWLVNQWPRSAHALIIFLIADPSTDIL